MRFLDKHFYNPRFYSIFINPYFISRYAILKQIRNFGKKIGNSKRILDIGCGIKPYENFFKESEYLGIEIKGGGHGDSAKKPDKYFDGRIIPFADDYFDAIICTQVLEHAIDPEKLLSESYRVLKDDGYYLFSVPFVYPEHEAPFDFRRFTKYGLEKEFAYAGLVVEKIIKSSGLFGVVGQLLSLYIFESFKARNILLKIIKLCITMIILAPLQIFFMFFDRVINTSGITLDYFVIGKKIK